MQRLFWNLGTKRKIIFLLCISFFSTSLVFSLTTVSSLVQYGSNIDREQLELLEDRQTVQFTGRVDFFTIGTYTIRNVGDDYQARLGVFFDALHDDASNVASDVQFFVDGRHVQHTEPKLVQGFAMEGIMLMEFAPGRNTAWVLIDVFFPENSTITIEVRYRLRTDLPSYNRSLIPNELEHINHWGGTTVFSVEIINDFIHRNNLEYFWIYNIIFRQFGDWNIINTHEYLRSLQELETDLMRIQKPNSNTIKIEFTDYFMDNYQRSFFIRTKRWEYSTGNWPYIMLSQTLNGHLEPNSSWEINLNFIDERTGDLGAYTNITQRELGIYEFIFLTRNQLRVMRNAFFARHGFAFQSHDLQNIFETLWRYQPNPNFHESMLTEIDRANIAIIQRLETLIGD
jgi:hypothetical protein